MQREWRDRAKEVDGVVDDEIIAQVVSGITGIPLTRLEKNEVERAAQARVLPAAARNQPARGHQCRSLEPCGDRAAA